ncbi:MAG: (d)CMP kinase [Vicingaceae bacterium]
MSVKKIIIAIDGYSSCGKSTVAKQLANYLNYIYIDTGAMYRAVTLYCLRKGIIGKNKMDKNAVIDALKDIHVTFHYNPATGKSETILNGENVEQEIRNIEVSNYVSEVAKIKEVRKKMVEIQREMGKHKGLVMDGRDIGSVVFPDAELKLFMTADKQVRAKRRYDELKLKGEQVSLDDIIKNIEKRDFEDVNRAENPLVQAPDAIVIDNTHLTPEEQFEKIKQLVEEKIRD